MYPVSDAFKAAVRDSHQSIIKAEVWVGDQLITELDLVSGSVSVDSRRAVRRSCNVTIVDPSGRGYFALQPVYLTYSDVAGGFTQYGDVDTDFPQYVDLVKPLRFDETAEPPTLVPASAGDTLSPFGNELRLYRGVRYVDGTEELVPLGVFVITTTEISDDGNELTISVSGDDRSVRISRARWTRPYAIATGTNVATAIRAILQDRYPDVQTNFITTSATTSSLVLGLDTDNDPWQDALKIAEAAGLDLYFDGEGVARLAPLPDVTSGAVVAEYDEGVDGVTLSITKSLSSEGTYNGVIATGEGSDVVLPVRGEAWDEDPISPTYRYGKFGEVPAFYSSPMITTEAQAVATATALLGKYLGADEAVQFGLVVNPAHDVGDVVRFTSAAIKVDRVLVLDSFTVPLSPTESMSAIARTTRIY